mmetsp:Transcript_97037/g.274212  ORF Transcript_97037/g.274212 Transcript_97037/m.274212 type:complete len:204 (+) Transcript_97037:866-1477(+)
MSPTLKNDLPGGAQRTDRHRVYDARCEHRHVHETWNVLVIRRCGDKSGNCDVPEPRPHFFIGEVRGEHVVICHTTGQGIEPVGRDGMRGAEQQRRLPWQHLIRTALGDHRRGKLAVFFQVCFRGPAACEQGFTVADRRLQNSGADVASVLAHLQVPHHVLAACRMPQQCDFRDATARREEFKEFVEFRNVFVQGASTPTSVTA